MNHLDLWHADKDSRNIKDDLQILSSALLKVLSAN